MPTIVSKLEMPQKDFWVWDLNNLPITRLKTKEREREREIVRERH